MDIRYIEDPVRFPHGKLHEVGLFDGDILTIPTLTKDQAGLVQIDGKLFVITKTGVRKPFLISLLQDRIKQP